jgi:uncharacterized protein
MNSKKTVVLGASPNPERYAWQAALRLQQHGHEVVAVGARTGRIGEVDITLGHPEVTNVHTVTLYLGPDRQPEHYDYILSLRPARIIFNPGTENPELSHLATESGIEPVEGCTLVMLSIGNF